MVHVAVYHWIIHGVGHGKPVDAQVYVLDDDDCYDGGHHDYDLYSFSKYIEGSFYG